MDVSKLPKWLLAIAVFMIALGFIISLYFLEETRVFFSWEFGPKDGRAADTQSINNLLPAIDYSDCKEERMLVDNERMVQCGTGFVVVGIGNSKGHSSTHNEPHDIKCCKLIAK